MPCKLVAKMGHPKLFTHHSITSIRIYVTETKVQKEHLKEALGVSEFDAFWEGEGEELNLKGWKSISDWLTNIGYIEVPFDFKLASS